MAGILNRAPSGSLAGMTGTKKEACTAREVWIGNKNALVHKKKQSQSRVFDQKVGRFAKEQDEAFSIFHWSCVISSVTYPINHSFMLTDPGQLCKTFRTALVEWDSQAFTLGKHPEKHLKRCINILENYLSELRSKETEYGIKTIGICNQCYFNYFCIIIYVLQTNLFTFWINFFHFCSGFSSLNFWSNMNNTFLFQLYFNEKLFYSFSFNEQ